MSIGERLKEERERLSFTQPALAAIAGTTKKSQIDYEKDLTQPKAGYLAAVARIGLDVQYVVTGERAAGSLTPDEQELLANFRAAPLAVKAAMMAAGAAGSAGAHNVQKVKKGVGQQFNGPVGSVATGDVVNHGKSKE
ncbi:helix-turn-helix domain-containing protein [Pseudomonas citronellolis]|uniref:helix-turn-helix domain-containing protein n=1 Tax=Pseudomonas citronellolis TaxID=53408 RepID=UPI0023E43DD4|nr:helix-turn-helix transcriptional regulator [Pseudomonas citronellolis]MDF3932957.1 helix-turn-helix transcriptional regulator [Pseudomonas citronellolis]